MVTRITGHILKNDRRVPVDAEIDGVSLLDGKLVPDSMKWQGNTLVIEVAPNSIVSITDGLKKNDG